MLTEQSISISINPLLLLPVLSTQCCKRLQKEKEEMCASYEDAVTTLKGQHEEELVQLENRYRPRDQKFGNQTGLHTVVGFKCHPFSVSDWRVSTKESGTKSTRYTRRRQTGAAWWWRTRWEHKDTWMHVNVLKQSGNPNALGFFSSVVGLRSVLLN